MQPDREHLTLSPHVSTFEKTLGELLDDFHTTVALARSVYLITRQINSAAGTDTMDQDRAMTERLDRQIITISEVAELAEQPIDTEKLRHLVSVQIEAPDDTDPFQISIAQISAARH